MWFDTHCHLDAAEFDADRPCVMADALAKGVTDLLIPAVETANFAAVADLCHAPADVANSRKTDIHAAKALQCWPAWGIHPLYVGRAAPPDLDALRHQIESHRPVAVGEIGLDGFIPDPDWALQEHYFMAQLKLAAEFDLPVVLHIRRAQDQVLKCLRRVRVKGGIAHAFNGSLQQAEQFIALGFVLGFGGAMTYSGSTRIRTLATTLPLEHLVLETDAPDIPPAWRSGGRNEPGDLPRMASVLAELRGTSEVQLAQATSANARRVLGLSC